MTDAMGPEFNPLTHQDLVEMAGAELPERTAMSLLGANLAAPIDAAVAVTMLADRSIVFVDANGEQPTAQGAAAKDERPMGGER